MNRSGLFIVPPPGTAPAVAAPAGASPPPDEPCFVTLRLTLSTAAKLCYALFGMSSVRRLPQDLREVSSDAAEQIRAQILDPPSHDRDETLLPNALGVPLEFDTSGNLPVLALSKGAVVELLRRAEDECLAERSAAEGMKFRLMRKWVETMPRRCFADGSRDGEGV